MERSWFRAPPPRHCRAKSPHLYLCMLGCNASCTLVLAIELKRICQIEQVSVYARGKYLLPVPAQDP